MLYGYSMACRLAQYAMSAALDQVIHLRHCDPAPTQTIRCADLMPAKRSHASRSFHRVTSASRTVTAVESASAGGRVSTGICWHAAGSARWLSTAALPRLLSAGGFTSPPLSPASGKSPASCLLAMSHRPTFMECSVMWLPEMASTPCDPHAERFPVSGSCTALAELQQACSLAPWGAGDQDMPAAYATTS